MGGGSVTHTSTQVIKIYDYLRISDDSGSIKSGLSGVGLTHRCLRGGWASNSDMVDGEATAVGCGEYVPATNERKPATDPAANTL